MTRRDIRTSRRHKEWERQQSLQPGRDPDDNRTIDMVELWAAADHGTYSCDAEVGHGA